MKNNNLDHSSDTIIDKKLDWQIVQSEMKIKFGRDIYESWIKKVEFVNEFSDYVLLSVSTRFLMDGRKQYPFSIKSINLVSISSQYFFILIS